MPNGRCRLHGGKSLGGIASPTFKTGIKSKYALPPRLQARYSAAVDDPALLEQRHEISVLDARLGDLLGRVDTGESGAIWNALMTARGDLLMARVSSNQKDMAEALNTIISLISKGHTDYQAWREVGTALDQRRKLVESERKRLIELQATITSEQAMLLMNALLMAVKANVSDRGALSAIQNEFLRLTTRTDHVIDVEQ